MRKELKSKSFDEDMDKYETYKFTGSEPKIITLILSTQMFPPLVEKL